MNYPTFPELQEVNVNIILNFIEHKKLNITHAIQILYLHNSFE